MRAVTDSIQRWIGSITDGWDVFWFKPADPHTLAMIRVLSGMLLLYTHAVWSLNLIDFFGPNSWITRDVARAIHSESYAFSYLWLVESPGLLWCLHLGALLVFFLLTIGWHTRVVSVLAFVITISYCHRLPGALFGLDQVNAMLAMYLMVGPSGAVYSVDRLLARRRFGAADVPPSVTANIAIRLIQVHMCIIYLFGGIGKMRGELWWDGSAVWFSIANLEYQSLDMTWLVRFPLLIAFLTHVTVLWETFYCFFVWSKRTRPICLLIAVAVHGGIALFLGMITFGFAMLIGNLAFVPPHIVAAVGESVWPKRANE